MKHTLWLVGLCWFSLPLSCNVDAMITSTSTTSTSSGISQCRDSDNETIFDSSYTARTCQWLTSQPRLNPILCNLSWTHARQNCPRTCGVCDFQRQQQQACGDDDNVSFTLHDQIRDCSWLRVHLALAPSTKKSRLCLRGAAYDICRYTCSNCHTQRKDFQDYLSMFQSSNDTTALFNNSPLSSNLSLSPISILSPTIFDEIPVQEPSPLGPSLALSDYPSNEPSFIPSYDIETPIVAVPTTLNTLTFSPSSNDSSSPFSPELFFPSVTSMPSNVSNINTSMSIAPSHTFRPEASPVVTVDHESFSPSVNAPNNSYPTSNQSSIIPSWTVYRDAPIADASSSPFPPNVRSPVTNVPQSNPPSSSPSWNVNTSTPITSTSPNYIPSNVVSPKTLVPMLTPEFLSSPSLTMDTDAPIADASSAPFPPFLSPPKPSGPSGTVTTDAPVPNSPSTSLSPDAASPKTLVPMLTPESFPSWTGDTNAPIVDASSAPFPPFLSPPKPSGPSGTVSTDIPVRSSPSTSLSPVAASPKTLVPMLTPESFPSWTGDTNAPIVDASSAPFPPFLSPPKPSGTVTTDVPVSNSPSASLSPEAASPKTLVPMLTPESFPSWTGDTDAPIVDASSAPFPPFLSPSKPSGPSGTVTTDAPVPNSPSTSSSPDASFPKTLVPFLTPQLSSSPSWTGDTDAPIVDASSAPFPPFLSPPKPSGPSGTVSTDAPVRSSPSASLSPEAASPKTLVPMLTPELSSSPSWAGDTNAPITDASPSPLPPFLSSLKPTRPPGSVITDAPVPNSPSASLPPDVASPKTLVPILTPQLSSSPSWTGDTNAPIVDASSAPFPPGVSSAPYNIPQTNKSSTPSPTYLQPGKSPSIQSLFPSASLSVNGSTLNPINVLPSIPITSSPMGSNSSSTSASPFSDSPSVMVSSLPTRNPSIRPSSSPSKTPSVSPEPTLTSPPTATPTSSPMPTDQPSVSPSDTPTRIPTISPSNSPSDFALQEQILIRQDVLMIMGNTYPMDLDEQNIWLNFTTKKLKYEVEKVIELENIVTLRIYVIIVDQSPPFSSSTPSSAPSSKVLDSGLRRIKYLRDETIGKASISSDNGQRRRYLEDEDDKKFFLNVTFDVEVRLRSPHDGDVGRFINGAFDSVDDRIDFITDLRNTGKPAFLDLLSIDLFVPDAPSKSIPQNILGIAVGCGIALAFIIVVLIFTRVRQQRRKSKESVPINYPATTNHLGFNMQVEKPNDILFNYDDDVSTLGDPLPHGFTREVSGEASTLGDGITLPYEFRAQYGSKSVKSEEKTEIYDVEEELSQDDVTLEAQYLEDERFAVDGPPGMLGLVLRDSSDEIPVVHAIQSSSPLASVQVGDKLISVDGTDVSNLSALEVSRLISGKQNQPVRQLVFVRPQGSKSVGDANKGWCDSYNNQNTMLQSKNTGLPNCNS